ncbi:EAL domain-containing protein, partial [Undibacterium sp. Di27W]|uniref:EAL domain-containing protein n=1 Tax=Undibacterium sp. Di27W TaxID=3413036 RepID=UPI003BF378BA
MEALIRWIRPDHGLVPPIEFIPVAESNGMILRLGDIVMMKACEQIATWKKELLPVVPISINVSAKQFSAGLLPKKLSDCLKNCGIDSSLLEVEITESAMMGEDNTIITDLCEIR